MIYRFQLSTLPIHSKTRRVVIGHGLVHSDNCVFCYILTVRTMLPIRLYPLDTQKRGNIHFCLPFIKRKKSLCDHFQNSAFFYHINSQLNFNFIDVNKIASGMQLMVLQINRLDELELQFILLKKYNLLRTNT